ncbi:tetratricopeptide repeat protein 27 isoform X2 [Capsicum chacoense]
MAEHQYSQFSSLRALELRLLNSTLPSHQPIPITSFSHLHTLIEQVLQFIELGQYTQALSSNAAKLIFSSQQQQPLPVINDSSDSAEYFYSEFVPNCVALFINNINDDGVEDSSPPNGVEKLYRAVLLMAVAVAALLGFTQCNITGPIVKLPPMPLGAIVFGEGASSDGLPEWEVWAQKELMSVGSDLRAKFLNLQYITFAKILLMRTKDLLSEGNDLGADGARSISWWLARLLIIQQKLLVDRSSSLFDLLQVFTRESIQHIGSPEKIRYYWASLISEEDASAIVSMFHLEAGIMELTYGRVDASRVHFESAAATSRLNFSLSGALGFRTLHQAEPKAQLFLVGSADGNDCSASLGNDFQNKVSTRGENGFPQRPSETHEASDILMTPRFLEDDKKLECSAQGAQNHSLASMQLKPTQQAVILAQCLSIEKRARSDELQRWEMAPYIEAIDSQQSSPFMVQHLCDILRIRWEATRGRTKQRALLMMDKVVQGIYDPYPGATQRMHCCFGVNIPTVPALRKEFGDLLVSCGLIGEAVKVYEDLELWDNLIYCYRLMEKKASAVELIQARLSERPSDPRLWCSLGDVTNDEKCYEKAQEVSGNKSTRAQRALARSAYNKGEYEKSKDLWESAMAMNSMYPDGWFALGAAALKARDVEKALDGFTRAVQLDPENGEAWNNIACLHMVKKKNKEAFIAFKEALKLKRDSWQMWENFSRVAADIGNFSQALEAVQKVLDMTNKKRIDVELLERMLQELELRTSTSHSECHALRDISDSAEAGSNRINVDPLTSSDKDPARERETEHLIQLVGKILRKIVQTGGDAEVWGLYARWHKLKGDLAMCSEALLKQVRSYQGSELWKDKDRFTKFAHASLELCKVYQEIAQRNGSHRELSAAEMHLKSTIKQAEAFSHTKEYQYILAFLDEVKAAQATP